MVKKEKLMGEKNKKGKKSETDKREKAEEIHTMREISCKHKKIGAL